MMDNEADVALWQQGILPEGEAHEAGPACYLFEASISAFSALLHILASDPLRFDSESYTSLRDEFRKFYMWNEGFSTRSGDLDHVLACSKNLKATVLGLMVHWVRTVLKIPGSMPAFDWTSVNPKFTQLQILTLKVEQIAESAISDMKSQYSVMTGLDIEDGSNSELDSDSDLESTMSDYSFDDIIEDLSTYLESLTDLSPSLDHPATDHFFLEDINASLMDELSTVSEPARPFVLIIKDRFPSLDARIVKRLGEANWHRRERLGMKLASAPEMGEPSSTEEDSNSSIGDTVVDPRQRVAEDQATIVSTVRSGMSLARTFQSATIESQFSEPSIFDNMSISAHSSRRFRPAESVTSFATSVGEALGQGQRRVPNLPEDHVYGSTFQCRICGDVLTGIRHRADWKKHVYNDLEPYLCLFSNCDLGMHTFQSRREWKYHEFQVHRVSLEWHCSICKDRSATQELFREHINRFHGSDIAKPQMEEFIAISKRLIACKIENELCPFCLTTPSRTQDGFASHVGKHQQEISLAALPRLDDFSDDEESVDDGRDSDGDDDDSDDTIDNGEHDSKKKDTDAGNAKMIVGLTPRKDSAFERLPEDIIKQLLLLATPDTFASLIVLNRKWRKVSQQAHVYAAQLSRCSSYAASNFFPIGTGDESTLPQLRQLFVREMKLESFQQRFSRPPIAVKETNLQAVTRISLNSPPQTQNRDALYIEAIGQETMKNDSAITRAPTDMDSDANLQRKSALGRMETGLDSPPSPPERSLGKISLSADTSSPVSMLSDSKMARHKTEIGNLRSEIEEGEELDVRSSSGPRAYVHKSVTPSSGASDDRRRMSGVPLGPDSYNSLKADLPTLFTLTSGANGRSEDQPNPQGRRLSHLPRTSIASMDAAGIARGLSIGQLNSSLEDFDRTCQTYDDLWSLISDISKQAHVLTQLHIRAQQMRRARDSLVSRSPSLDPSSIQRSASAIQLCAAELQRLNVVLVALLPHRRDEQDKQSRGSSTRLIGLFIRKKTEPEPRLRNAQDVLENANDILDSLRGGTDLLNSIGLQPLGTTQILAEGGPTWPGKFGEASVHESTSQENSDFNGNTSTSSRSASSALGARSPPANNVNSTLQQSILKGILKEFGDNNEKLASESQKPRPRVTTTSEGGLGPWSSADSFPNTSRPTSRGVEPAQKGRHSPPDDSLGIASTSSSRPRVSISESLKAELGLGDSNQADDDEECWGCGEILEEGKAFELDGNRWHLNCFRCNTCGILLDSDANLLLLGDGSLICNNCTYSCSACGNKIEDLAILTGDQAFCATCFRCRNCKRKIENLRYARTSQGIFCMSCHESLMAQRRKKSRAAANAKLKKDGQPPMLVDKSVPALPPNAISQSVFSPDRETPDSLDTNTPTELSSSPRQGYTQNDSSSRSSSML